MNEATWDGIVRAYRDGVVSRDQLWDFRYKREHPARFRRRRAARCLRRWRRNRARMQYWHDLANPVSYFNPDARIFPGLLTRIVFAPVVIPLALAVLARFWVAYLAVWTWHGLPLVFLERHRRRVCAPASREEGLG